MPGTVALNVLEAAGHRSPAAEPFPQGVVLCGGGLFVAATGGGGGAAQLLPAPLLRTVLLRARLDACSGGTPQQRLAGFFRCVDERMQRVVSDESQGVARYLGSSAQVVAAAGDGTELWVGSAGLGRALRIEHDRMVALTRDDSLFQDFLDGRPSPEEVSAFLHHGIVTAVLNGTWREQRSGWKPAKASLGPGDGLLLATEALHQAVPEPGLHAWAREALNASRLDSAVGVLFERARAQARSRSAFDRTAAVVLIRRRAAPASPGNLKR